MSGIYLFKTVIYGVLAVFLLLQRNEMLLIGLDFEILIGSVLIMVALLEFGVNLVAYITSFKQNTVKN
ncbi:hypothetical protein [Planococcus dechangensis]|uniref:Uncharacterized protein n=1 Tax=Planococcus dechangensis TaxID=1176255 RepID=A0ABV9MBP1_9BACL